MVETYYIFNKSDNLRIMGQFEKDEAINIVQLENKKAGIEMFYCLSSAEHMERLRKFEESGGFDNIDDYMRNIWDSSPEMKELRGLIDADYEKASHYLNGFSLPISVKSNDEYVDKLKQIFDKYISEISKPAFESEADLADEVRKICAMTIRSLDLAICHQYSESESILAEILKGYMNLEFGVSALDKCYAFRGLAPFDELHARHAESNTYACMMSDELSFFRGRAIDKDNDTKVDRRKDICSLSFSDRKKSNDLRFSSKGEVCLYLGTTTYVCSQECRWDKNSQDFYIAAFKINKSGEKLKILNLVVSEPLINGIYHKSMGELDGEYRRMLKSTMIKLFPLVIATSFTVKADEIDSENNRDIKYEYLLSQRLIKAIQQSGIDGIAYLSRQGSNDFQFPHGVNLAIPMNDISDTKQYSDLYECFEMTKPVLFYEPTLVTGCIGSEDSYINKKFPQFVAGSSTPNINAVVDWNGKNIFYGETPYSKFDNYLINQNFCKFEADE